MCSELCENLKAKFSLSIDGKFEETVGKFKIFFKLIPIFLTQVDIYQKIVDNCNSTDNCSNSTKKSDKIVGDLRCKYRIFQLNNNFVARFSKEFPPKSLINLTFFSFFFFHSIIIDFLLQKLTKFSKKRNEQFSEKSVKTRL
jgi:hypothetical protein